MTLNTKETSPPATATRRSRIIKWAAGIITLLIIALIVRTILHHAHKPPIDESVPVVTALAQVGKMDVTLRALGTITPPRNITLRTQITGQLLRMPFNEGQMVKAGDVVAEIDDRPFRAALMQAEGQLNRDEALLSNAKLDLTRYETLWKQNSVSKQTLDTQVALVKQDEGTVKLDQGLVETARVNLIYTKILAPVSGRIGLRQVDPGNIVQISDVNGLVVLTQTQPITALFSLPQDTLSSVLTAQTRGQLEVEAWNPSDQERLASGILESIDNQIDTTTGTYKLRAHFANLDNSLFPNQFVNIRLRTEQLSGVTVLPSAAVQQESIGPCVYVIKPDHKATLRKITLGPTTASRVVINQGVAPGEAVVIDGADRLKEGTLVREITPTTPKVKHTQGGV